MVRDFVGGQAGGSGDLLRQLEHVGGEVLFRQAAEQVLGVHLAEDGAVLDGQLVEREVRGAEVERAVQFVAPGGEGLVLAGVDQVDGDAVEGGLCDGDGICGLVHAVHPAEAAEVLRVKRLNSKGNAVDTGFGVTVEPGGLDAAGVGFEGDLDVIRQRPGGADAVKDALDGGGFHQGGRAAAEEDGVQDAALGQGTDAVDFGFERLQPPGLVDTGGDVAVEVAVGAFRLAEGPVEIEAEAGVAPIFVGLGVHQGNRAATSLWKASARWERRFFSQRSISPKVWV